MRNPALKFIASCVAAGAFCYAAAQNVPESLKKGFEDPPAAAKPRVWWHWMNGNITQEGIRLDLEWMRRVGLGGFQVFDGNLSTPQVVKKRLIYMTPEWRNAFKYATLLGDQLGLEEAIASSPGWSETGGPWVKPEEGMKKYVWSETRVEGGKPFTGVLTHPPSNTGPFQNLEIENEGGTGPKSIPPQFYADSAVVAYKLPASDIPLASLHPKITASGGPLDAAILSDGDLVKTYSLALNKTVGGKAWIQYEFDRPQTIRALTIVLRGTPLPGFLDRGGNTEPTLEASDDGKDYHAVAAIPSNGFIEHTIAFGPITAKYFRVTFKTPPPTPHLSSDLAELAAQLGYSIQPVTEVQIAELVLHPGARIDRFEEKAAFKPVPDLYKFATPDVAVQDAIDKNDVIDLTGKMHPDGTLDWAPPEGSWVVLRIGYSLLGITNHPASPEATGLEVDKLNRKYVKDYMDSYLGLFRDTVGEGMMGKRGIRYLTSDSWEAGAQNWTDDMIAQFTKRRGYDPHPWLPVLAGHVVESAQASDQFLWDFRKTIADLVADAHYGQMEASLKERGMGHYGESHEGGRAMIADGMEVKKLDDVPMGAMWTQTLTVNKPEYDYIADDRESASVAHIYGQNLAAAESMTTCNPSLAWAWSPSTLKPTVDQEFLSGINRIVIHESALQPLVGKAPGMTLGPCGQAFNRNETWAEQAGPWVTYLARSSFMLQQGQFVADVIYFYGEDSNITAIFDAKAPDIPPTYNYDYINSDGLIHALSASSGTIKAPSGITYRLLALDPYSKIMSLPVLRAIHKLVMDGAIVSGEKPIRTPSLADDPAEFKRLSDELFGDGTGVHFVGKGRVYAGLSVEAVLKSVGVAPDFDPGQPRQEQRIYFLHRKLVHGDIYFLDNRSDQAATVNASFRVAGMAPELWYADTGKSQPASYRIAEGRTTVPISLVPWGTVFVVFRQPARSPKRTLPKRVESIQATLEGPWSLSFQPGRGAPPSNTLDKLTSWSENNNRGVKYFSGSGTYSKTFPASADWFKPNRKLFIDLGDVRNLAEVTVNGKSLGIVWHAPFRVDATASLKPGINKIAIKVTNAWVNRLIGDQQPDATVKYTFSDFKPYRASSPLQPSGLLGPVRVVSQTAR